MNWEDVDGSKLNLLDASFTMLRDFLLIRILFLLNLWKINDETLYW